MKTLNIMISAVVTWLTALLPLCAAGHISVFIFEWSAGRGVARFDGARDKKQVWCPQVRTWVFRKQLYCIEESTCDIVGTFRCPPQWFGVPIMIWRQRIVPACPPRYAPVRRYVSSASRWLIIDGMICSATRATLVSNWMIIKWIISGHSRDSAYLR